MSDVQLIGSSEHTRSGFVAIVGKPNVGKSTLLNTLLGVKVAPITPKPQTTRRGVRGIYTFEDKQIVFVDTPGYHRGGSSLLDETMHREVTDAIADTDAVLWVVDLRRPPNEEDRDVARLLQNINPKTKIYVVGNKVDTAKYPEEALELYKDLAPQADRAMMISALQKPNDVYALRDELLDLLEPGPFFYPDNIRSDQSAEHWASEIIREAAMTHLRQELPYSVAVQVIEWEEPDPDDPKPVLHIHAEIWVERRNHRSMVIGKGGVMIREIGKMARKQLETFLQQQVFLDLFVVVRGAWRDDREALRELGYQP